MLGLFITTIRFTAPAPPSLEFLSSSWVPQIWKRRRGRDHTPRQKRLSTMWAETGSDNNKQSWAKWMYNFIKLFFSTIRASTSIREHQQALASIDRHQGALGSISKHRNSSNFFCFVFEIFFAHLFVQKAYLSTGLPWREWIKVCTQLSHRVSEDWRPKIYRHSNGRTTFDVISVVLTLCEHSIVQSSCSLGKKSGSAEIEINHRGQAWHYVHSWVVHVYILFIHYQW